MSRIYCAGKMRKIPYYNFPAFDEARDRLLLAGYEVVSPADLDRAEGFDALDLPEDTDWSKVPECFSLPAIMKRDLAALMECDGIYMLHGWMGSTGARAEYAVAIWAGLFVHYQASSAIHAETSATDRSIRG